MLILIGVTIFFATPQSVEAARVFPEITPQCDMELNSDHIVDKADRCGFNDMIQLFINLFDWGLAILSILSVAFFIIGGGYLLLSGGNADRVKTGTSILKNTVFGILIALASWLIVNTVIGILVGSNTLDNVQVFGKNWWGAQTCSETYNTQCSQYALEQGCGDGTTTYVSELQQLISTAPGCPTLTPDGCFGPQTANAVLAVNTANHIDGAGSTATQETWNALRENPQKGCTVKATTPTLASGTGCCVPRCGTGIDNTAETTTENNGCRDIYDGAFWYDATCGNTTQTVTGCCIPLNFDDQNEKCIGNPNKRWCDEQPTYRYDEKSCENNSSLCSAGTTLCTR